MFEVILRNGVKKLVFHEDFIPLSEVQEAVAVHFPFVSKDRLWLESPNYTWNQDWYLLVCEYPKTIFIDHDTSLECVASPYVSLAQIEGRLVAIEVPPEIVKVFWPHKGELCLTIKKEPGENYHGGEECPCCQRFLCKCSGQITHCVTCKKKTCSVCCCCNSDADHQT
jgi:hypothetical protein